MSATVVVVDDVEMEDVDVDDEIEDVEIDVVDVPPGFVVVVVEEDEDVDVPPGFVVVVVVDGGTVVDTVVVGTTGSVIWVFLHAAVVASSVAKTTKPTEKVRKRAGI